MRGTRAARILLAAACFGLPLRFFDGEAAASPSCSIRPEGAGQGSVVVGDGLDKFASARERLNKGLSITLLNQVTKTADDTPFVFGCRITYDLWDEDYVFTPIVGGLLVKQQTTTAKNLQPLPRSCSEARLPWHVPDDGRVHVTTLLDPVSDEQVQRTRKWLAERGIGAGTGTLAGRAAYAMVNLKQEQSVERVCNLEKGSPP
jgi:hypothetical protein